MIKNIDYIYQRGFLVFPFLDIYIRKATVIFVDQTRDAYFYLVISNK
jgi:hypothetical protein